MSDYPSRHAEVVELLRRHTEARAAAATEAVRQAVTPPSDTEEADDADAGV